MDKIYYFSGTGNSLSCAKKIAANLQDFQILDISREFAQGNFKVECARLVFVFPVYAYEMPLLVRRFVKRADINADYIAAVATYGSSAGGAYAEMKRLLKRKRLKLNFKAGVKTVENYIPIFGATRPQTIEAELIAAEKAEIKAAQQIFDKNTNDVCTFRPLSKLVSSLFRLFSPLMTRFFRVNKKKCNGCGICTRVCPVGAIKIKNGRARYKTNCAHCQACFNACPQKALTFARLRAKTARYRNPSVTLNELMHEDNSPNKHGKTE